MNRVWLMTLAGLVLTSGAAMAQERGEAEVFIDGKSVSFPREQRPYFWSGTIMVPLKETSGKLGLDYAETQGFSRIRFRGNEAIYRRYEASVELNGRSVRLPRPGESRADVVYVPAGLFEALTGRRFYSFLRLQTGIQPPTVPNVSYLGKPIRLNGGERPFFVRNTLFLPLDPIAGRTDTRVQRNYNGDRGRHRITHGAEVVIVEVGSPEVELNGNKWRLNEPVIERDGRIFLPGEVWLKLLDRELTLANPG